MDYHSKINTLWVFRIKLILLLIIAFLGYKNSVDLSRSSGWVQDSYNNVVLLEKQLVLVQASQCSYRSYVLTGDDYYITIFKNSLDGAKENEKMLEERLSDKPKMLTLVSIMGDKFTDKVKFAKKAIHARQSEGREAAVKIINSTDDDDLTTDIQNIISALKKQEYTLLRRKMDVYRANSQITLNMIPVLAIIDIVLISSVYCAVKYKIR